MFEKFKSLSIYKTSKVVAVAIFFFGFSSIVVLAYVFDIETEKSLKDSVNLHSTNTSDLLDNSAIRISSASDNLVIDSTNSADVAKTATTTAKPTPEPIVYVFAKGEYVYRNERSLIKIKYPADGGSITGNVSGKCNMAITGQYNSSSREVYGVLEGRCKDLGFSFENTGDLENAVAKGKYSGKVRADQKQIEVNFEGGLYPYSPFDNTTRYLPFNGGHVSLSIE